MDFIGQPALGRLLKKGQTYKRNTHTGDLISVWLYALRILGVNVNRSVFSRCREISRRHALRNVRRTRRGHLHTI